MDTQSVLHFKWTVQQHVASGSLLSALLAAVVSLAAAADGRRAFGHEFDTTRPRLTQAQKRIVWKLEQQLKLPPTLSTSPGDRNIWYVIIFTDTAIGARQSRSTLGDTVTITRERQVARQSAAAIAHGRHAAALLLLQYYYAGNSAAKELKPTAGGRTERAIADSAKHWRFRAFSTEEEARAYLNLITPTKKK